MRVTVLFCALLHYSGTISDTMGTAAVAVMVWAFVFDLLSLRK